MLNLSKEKYFDHFNLNTEVTADFTNVSPSASQM